VDKKMEMQESEKRKQIQGDWIWAPGTTGKEYNQYYWFTHSFDLEKPSHASLRITADSWYRLYINDEWVNDGPCRSWPQHYQYDVLDVTSWLTKGKNQIKVLVRYFGAGHFHRIPQRGGLLADLEITSATGDVVSISSGDHWQVNKAVCWIENVPKVGLGMEPFEYYDARLAEDSTVNAEVIAAAGDGPWRNLAPRDVALLTRIPRDPLTVHSVQSVDSFWQGYSFSLIRRLYPNLIEGDGASCMASAAATILKAESEGEIEIQSYPEGEGPKIYVNGDAGNKDKYKIQAGDNLVLALFRQWGHHNKEQGIRFVTDVEVTLENPRDASASDVWDFIPFDDLAYHEQDQELPIWNSPARRDIQERVEKKYQTISQAVRDRATYSEHLGPLAQSLNGTFHSKEDPHWRFECRQVIDNTRDLVTEPQAMLSSTPGYSTIEPDSRGDMEVCVDLGAQNCGYYRFEIEAEDGVIVDIFGIEHIAHDGGVQHTWGNRNGMRYVCKPGRNTFLSTKRRSGRYIYITLRNQKSPVRIHRFQLIESTYPVERTSSFSCSDTLLTEIWRISERTLKLCMEDAFTDCPLYEQTLWVGDARNEALFAMTAYGQTDIMRRCIRLAAQGLEISPFVPSHCPTSNGECYLPAWSFLWVMSVWDYYYFTADIEFLKEIWPWVLKDLEGTKEYCTDRELFSGPFWNMFDWSGIDDGHQTVIHNSMLIVGALDSAIKCAQVLEDSKNKQFFTTWRNQLKDRINELWDHKKESYIDSIHEDGILSSSISTHTSILSILYDIIPDNQKAMAERNVISPPSHMTPIGSPFVSLYLFLALEQLGKESMILDRIKQDYLPMIEQGATTVWEQFDNGTGFNPKGYPTRSHCHAWSSSPIYFLNRLVLGIQQAEPGCKKFVISPIVDHHEWANGASATPSGPIRVSWKKDGKKLRIDCEAPRGVDVSFKRNDTHQGYSISINGKAVSEKITEPQHITVS
jgi:hypothetical protein